MAGDQRRLRAATVDGRFDDMSELENNLNTPERGASDPQKRGGRARRAPTLANEAFFRDNSWRCAVPSLPALAVLLRSCKSTVWVCRARRREHMGRSGGAVTAHAQASRSAPAPVLSSKLKAQVDLSHSPLPLTVSILRLHDAGRILRSS